MELVSEEYLRPFQRRNWDKAVKNNGLSSLLRDFFTVPDYWDIANLKINTEPVLETLVSQYASLTDVVKFNFYLCFPYIKYHQIPMHRPVLSTIAVVLFQGVPSFIERVTKEFLSLIAQPHSEEMEKAIVTKAKHVDLICTTANLFDVMPDAYKIAIRIVRMEMQKMLNQLSYDREQARAVGGLLEDDDELFSFIKKPPFSNPPNLEPEVANYRPGARNQRSGTIIQFGNTHVSLSRVDAEKMEKDRIKAAEANRKNQAGIAKIQEIMAREEELYNQQRSVDREMSLEQPPPLPAPKSRPPPKNPPKKRDWAAETLKRRARMALRQGKPLPDVVHTSKPGGGFEVLIDNKGYPVNRSPATAKPAVLMTGQASLPSTTTAAQQPLAASNPVQPPVSQPLSQINTPTTVRYISGGHVIMQPNQRPYQTNQLPHTRVTHTLVHQTSAQKPIYVRTIVETGTGEQQVKIVEKMTPVKKLEQRQTKVILQHPAVPFVEPVNVSATESEVENEIATGPRTETGTPFPRDLKKIHNGHIDDSEEVVVQTEEEGIPVNQYNNVPALYPSVHLENEKPSRRVIKGQVFSIPPKKVIRNGNTIPNTNNRKFPGTKVCKLTDGAMRTISGSPKAVLLRPFTDEKGITVLRIVPESLAETKRNLSRINSNSSRLINYRAGVYRDGIRVVQPVTLVSKTPFLRPTRPIKLTLKPASTTASTSSSRTGIKPIPNARIQTVHNSPAKKPMNFAVYQGGQPFLFQPNQRNQHYEKLVKYQEQSRHDYSQQVQKQIQEQNGEQYEPLYDTSDYISRLHQIDPCQQVAHYEEVVDDSGSGLDFIEQPEEVYEEHVENGLEEQQNVEWEQPVQNYRNYLQQPPMKFERIQLNSQISASNTNFSTPMEVPHVSQPQNDPTYDFDNSGYIDNVDDIPNGNLIQYIDEGNVADGGYQQDALLENNTLGENNLIDQALQMAMYPDEEDVPMMEEQYQDQFQHEELVYEDEQPVEQQIEYAEDKNGQLQPTVAARYDYDITEDEYEEVKMVYADLFRQYSGSMVDEQQRRMMTAFILGRLENPSPKLSLAYTIQIYERTQNVVIDNYLTKQVVEMSFEMNFETMQWSRVRRTQIYSRNGVFETVEYPTGPDADDEVWQNNVYYQDDGNMEVVDDVHYEQEMEMQQQHVEYEQPIYC